MKAAKDPAAQSEHAAAPDAEYFPATHGTHFDMPVLAAYVPAAQSCTHASDAS
jgi:lipopolysaccharide export system protein LptC